MATAPSDYQPNFFDPVDPGEAAKQDGMDRAELHANSDFKEAAQKIIYHHAKHNPTVTINILWDGLDLLGITTHENKASGPVMRRCAKQGWIRKTNMVDTTTRPTRNKGSVAIWESLICDQEVVNAA